jgi:hypothetical protein
MEVAFGERKGMATRLAVALLTITWAGKNRTGRYLYHSILEVALIDSSMALTSGLVPGSNALRDPVRRIQIQALHYSIG